MWWPQDVKAIAAANINLPKLLDTQAQFLSILILAKDSPFKVFDLIEAAEFPANLFLKHLAILTDFGGEPIKRLGKSFLEIFPIEDGQCYFDFVWLGHTYRYKFEQLPVANLSNTRLSIDGKGQKNDSNLTPLMKDMIAILLFAGSSNQALLAGLDVCDVGELLGDEARLMQYVKQKYLVVSRITGGTIANSLGQVAQRQIVAFLKGRLGHPYTVTNNSKIILRGYDKKGGMPFDIVIGKGIEKKIGIEISFQVTTNSTIERKAGQAAARQRLMHDDGHHIAYILDGAGNFERKTAFTTIINYSDFVGAYSETEFERLAQWIEMIL